MSQLRIRAITVLAVTFASFNLGQVTAQNQPVLASGGINVSPGLLNLTVTNEIPDATAAITITNNYDAPISISGELRKIDEEAGLLIPTDLIDETLAPSLIVSETDILIPAKSKKVINLTFRNTDNLAPGGHYATLLFSQRSSMESQLSLRSAISLHLFLTKKEGTRLRVSLSNFSSSSWPLKLPASATLGFQNEGNVHLTPRASVQVLDRHGNIIAKGVANEGSQPILPGKSLHSVVTLKTIRSVWYPQRLSLLALYRADTQTESQARIRTFWYIPPVFLVASMIFAVVLVSSMIYRHNIQYFIRKHHKKNISPPQAKPPNIRNTIKVTDLSHASTISVKSKGKK
jgi:hypothetical protein